MSNVLILLAKGMNEWIRDVGHYVLGTGIGSGEGGEPPVGYRGTEGGRIGRLAPRWSQGQCKAMRYWKINPGLQFLSPESSSPCLCALGHVN